MQRIDVVPEIASGDAAKQMAIKDEWFKNQMVIEDAMIVPRVEKWRKDRNKYEDHYYDTCTTNGSVY